MWRRWRNAGARREAHRDGVTACFDAETVAERRVEARTHLQKMLNENSLHSLWIGQTLGPLEVLCLQSWVRLGYEVTLHAYAPLETPAGVAVVDANLLMPAKQIFRDRRSGSLAPFSDVFRAQILMRHEATWLDTDIFLLGRLPLDSRNVLAREYLDGADRFNNAVMRLEPGHPILKEIVARYRNPLRALDWRRPRKQWSTIRQSLLALRLSPAHLRWGALGAQAINDQIARTGFDGQVLGAELCLNSAKTPLFSADEGAERALAGATYVHLYKSQLKLDLGRPTPGSVYAGLWARLDEGR